MSSETMSETSGNAREHTRAGMHGARYGEVLLLKAHLTHMEATVYNTLGLNDCPQEEWDKLDPEEIKKEYHVNSAALNGPRYFLMDQTTIANPGEIATFGGLQMRRLATVKIPLTALLGGLKNKPYSERIVDRTTTFIWSKGREVYELVNPQGQVYVMQSYSVQIEPTLAEEDLRGLGSRLHLPESWQYRTRVVEGEFRLKAAGEAYLVQDDLANSYQRLDNI